MRFIRRALTGVFLIGLTLALLGAAGWTFYSAFTARLQAQGQAFRGSERQFAVNVITAQSGSVTPVLTTFGEVLARRSLQLRVPVGGTIVDISPNVEDGGSVAAGEVLLRLDDTDARAALKVAEADVQEARGEMSDATAALDIARDDLTAAQTQSELRTAALARQQGLADRGIATTSVVEDAALSDASAKQAVLSKRTALATASARVNQAQTAVLRAEIARDEAARALADTVLAAQFAGILSDVAVTMGGLVTANEQIATMIDPTALEVSFRLTTDQYSRLLDAAGTLVNAPVQMTLDASGAGLTAMGRVTRESAAVGEGQSGRLLFASVSDAGRLRPGDFVSVAIEEPALEGVALLPATAVDAAGTVLAVTADSRLEQLDAPVLRRQGDDVIVDASAIAGRQVVSERSPLLGAGIQVRISGSEAVSQTSPRGPPDSPPAAQDDPGDVVALTPERRAKLIAFVESNERMPAQARASLLDQLTADEVPASVILRLEARMGS
ncbi:Multidrug resistance protein MdtE precursor [Aquimixticola soesokkakensis]|uniref:Multidrug resistance protein MdtE n=1 Tax=Aquimixticola soesokkakensis TaxID=1519096 RepID=A0A1Y5RPI4_9RHOB|nr:HlyD family efflux transporter periplasmic adaptor subunit [Aquimixticola soesokkakensis]SLN21172.1 Multidrug resistance protein MdtE precursor [Aquimixticola soesokkakensis]